MNGYAAEIKRLLLAAGWQKLRSGKGSHEIWGKPGCRSVTIPHECKPRPLANKILKDCGIDKRF